MTASHGTLQSSGSAISKPAHLGHLALLYVAFSLLFLVTSLLFESEILDRRQKVQPGGTVGPITVVEKNTVYEVLVQRLYAAANTWSYVEVQVLDANQEYLLSFGDELSQYSGRDSEGYWTESEETYSTKITVSEPGIYFLKIVVEESNDRNSQFRVTINRLQGSSLLHLVAGIAALAIAIVLNELRNRTISQLAAMWLDDD